MSTEYSTRPRRSPHDPDFTEPRSRLLASHTMYPFPVFPDDSDPDGPIYVTDQLGYVMTRDEAMKLFHRIIAGIDAVGDEEVEAHNLEVAEKLRRAPRSSTYEDRRPAPAPRPKRKPRPGDVYLVTNGHLYKIGVSTNTNRRVKEIERYSGMPVEIVATMSAPDMLAAELELHKRYADYRREGEWFDLPDDVLASLIDEMGGAA